MNVYVSTAAIATAAVTVLSAAPAMATTINFDNLGANVVVTNQYPQATFSSDAGEVLLTTAQNLGSSLPNFICTAPTGGSIDCTHDVFVSFTTAVSGLKFLAIGADNTGVIGQVNVTASSGNGVVNIIGAGNNQSPVSVDLSAFTGVSSIAIVNDTDAAGLGFDDFTFNTASAAPEPATWAMMIIGLGMAGSALRRRAAVATS